MADKIKKILAKLTVKEQEIVKLLILRVKLGDTDGLNISHLKGHTDLFRVKKGRILYSLPHEVVKDHNSSNRPSKRENLQRLVGIND